MTSRSLYWIKLFLPVLYLSLAVDCLADAARPADLSNAGIELSNARYPQANVITGGQPSPEQIRAMQAAGIKHVINLRTPGEMDWDEKALVTSLGMQYHSIPVAGASGINADNAKALHDLMQSIGDEPLALHCASGNRVGALVALDAAAKGDSVDAAIAEGKKWGMTRLEDLVREKLNIDPQLCCLDQKNGGNE